MRRIAEGEKAAGAPDALPLVVPEPVSGPGPAFNFDFFVASSSRFLLDAAAIEKGLKP